MRKVIVNSTPIISLIDAVMPVIAKKEKQGIFFSDELKARVKRVAGE